MTRHQVAALACKILGIYAIVKALGMPLQFLIVPLRMVFRGVGGGTNILTLIGASASFVLLIVFGILLWRLADRLAGCMTSGAEVPSVEERLRGADLQRIAFSVVGLFVLAHAIPEIPQLAYLLSAETQYGEMEIFAKAQIGRLVAKLVIGFGLFFGSRALVGLLNRLRTAGVKKPENFTK